MDTFDLGTIWPTDGSNLVLANVNIASHLGIVKTYRLMAYPGHVVLEYGDESRALRCSGFRSTSPLLNYWVAASFRSLTK